MEKIKYIITLSFDLGSMVDKVTEIEKSMNTILSKYGVNEKLSIRSNVKMTMYCDREITKKEKNLMIALIENQKSKMQNIKVESIRKSCNKSCFRQSESR